jgi:tellurite resistance protein TerC
MSLASPSAASPVVDFPFSAWLLFAIVVVISLVVDLALHRGNRSVSRRGALVWSGVWIALSLAFAGWVALAFGARSGVEFLTAYLVEKSLSVDNLFVFLVIFRALRIPKTEQHRVLFWGILGAFATRAVFILAGATLLDRWHYAVYVLGAFLVYTGVKTFRSRQENEDQKAGRLLSFLQRRLPVTERLHGHHFTVVEAGKRMATPLFVALLAIEGTDIIFAVDSIAAVLAISSVPFIVFTSNVFAILGLRALYLVIADLVANLRYLHYGLGGILVFVGAKMVASRVVHLPHWLSLVITVTILLAAVIPSLIVRRRHPEVAHA